MAWVSEQSSESEKRLDRAWGDLNRILDQRVPLAIQMRVTACIQDSLCHATLLRKLEGDEIARAQLLQERRDAWKPGTGPPPHWDSHHSFQFAAALKAAFYFVRSLHDAVYCALLEGTGQSSGTHSSMYDCAKNPRTPLHGPIAAALPGYFEWFRGFRDLRNQLKLGASNSFEFRDLSVSGKAQVTIVLSVIDSVNRHVGQGRQVSLADLMTAFDQSSTLLEWAASYLRDAA